MLVIGRMYLHHREIFNLSGEYSWAKGKLVFHLYLAQIVYAYEKATESPFIRQLGLYILSMCMNLWLYEQPYRVIEVFDDPTCSRPSYSISFPIEVLYNLFTGFQPAINTNDLPIKAGVSLCQEDCSIIVI